MTEAGFKQLAFPGFIHAPVMARLSRGPDRSSPPAPVWRYVGEIMGALRWRSLCRRNRFHDQALFIGPSEAQPNNFLHRESS